MTNHRLKFNSIATFFIFACGLLLVPLTTSCSAIVRTMDDADALKTLRELTRNGKLPPEATVLEIENRFAKTSAGALAKLLRARIRFENNDFAGAAQILNTNVFKEKTNLGDYAAWLRGRALQSSGNHQEAMNTFENLIKDYPNSLRAREAKILWANSAMASGQAARVPKFLEDESAKSNPDAMLLTAKAFENTANQAESVKFYRRVYFYGAGTGAAKEAETKLVALGQNLTPVSAEEIRTRADKLHAAKNYAEAVKSFDTLIQNFPAAGNTPPVHLKRVVSYANLKRMPDASNAFAAIPAGAPEKREAFYELAVGYAKNRLFANARTVTEDMRRAYPTDPLTPKTIVAVGLQARDARNKIEEQAFLRGALAAFPNAPDVAGAQFELAWLEHEQADFAASSLMLTEHLARYVDKDTTNRGKAGYWAARDSEKANKITEACALYDAMLHRYAANWYGYLAEQRLTAMRGRGQCRTVPQFPAGSILPKAIANLKTVTVAPETAGARELERAEKSEQLSTVGLFDWSIDELQEAQVTAVNSPKINLALAKHFRFKGDNVSALLALAKSYPDYSQMNPEEMGQEEWDIFYPLTNWNDIKYWAKQRNLDHYQVAGLIRQESVFNPRARSGAAAYGLMQLLVPTARMMARKYGAAGAIDGNTLFQPALNIELGTAYMKDQFASFGRIEYVAAAYNAGPGRVPPWRASLPYEMDEFVEAVPFRETKAYIQGVIRNSAQYRRLYDENGKFKANVGSNPLRGQIDSKPREQFAQEFPEIVLDDKPTGE